MVRNSVILFSCLVIALAAGCGPGDSGNGNQAVSGSLDPYGASLSASTPVTQQMIDGWEDPATMTAVRDSSGLVVLTRRGFSTYLKPTQINGVARTVRMTQDGSDNLVAEGGFPRIVDVAGVGSGVLLNDGYLVQVEE
ncbi:MAG: hypothetical protein O7H41_19190 [Planctomycetota bacterium]|nr:hypothetical protein [Planctomycetota bacterium]